MQKYRIMNIHALELPIRWIRCRSYEKTYRLDLNQLVLWLNRFDRHSDPYLKKFYTRAWVIHRSMQWSSKDTTAASGKWLTHHAILRRKIIRLLIHSLNSHTNWKKKKCLPALKAEALARSVKLISKLPSSVSPLIFTTPSRLPSIV